MLFGVGQGGVYEAVLGYLVGVALRSLGGRGGRPVGGNGRRGAAGGEPRRARRAVGEDTLCCEGPA